MLLQDPLNSGKLGAATTFTTVSLPNEIAAGDIDQDGFVDIVVAGERSVAWHPQQANGSFSTREDIGVGVDTLALVDFDDNGLLDVVTQDGTPNGNVLVYLQTSMLTGVFKPPQSTQVGISLQALDTGDLNGNGRVDIAAAGFDVDKSYQSFGLWYPVLQTSANPPTFVPQRHLGATPNGWARAIAISDLNGDGRSDAVIGNWNGAANPSNVQVFLQTNTPGEFRSDAVYGLPGGGLGFGDSMHAVSVADLNGDLLPDIVASNDEVFVLFQQQGAPGRFDRAVLVLGSQP